MNTVSVSSWLLTYLIHSTLLLGVAWLFSRALGERLMPLQETLLRAALIGGLLTATAQVGLGFEPVGGVFVIDALSTSGPTATIDEAALNTSLVSNRAPTSRVIRMRDGSLWPVAFVSLWIVGSLLAMLAIGRSALDLRHLLKTRSLRPQDRLLSRLAAAMGMRRHVRLSTSAAIALPFATGIQKPEVCCPERIDDLAVEHKKSLFAHELAHLVRHDPAWQLLYRIGEAIFILQPLNRLVRRRLEEIAEHLTDERAVACTGDRLGLARCLVVVAHWGVSPGLPVTAFASGPRLDRRVRHLISGKSENHSHSLWAVALVIASVIVSAICMPAVAPSIVHAESSLDRSATTPTKTWSSADQTPAKAAPPAPAVPSSPINTVPTVEPIPATAVSPLPNPPAGIAPAPELVPAAAAAPAPETAPVAGVAPAPPSPSAAPEPPCADDEKAPSQPPDQANENSRARAEACRKEAQRARAEARQLAREAAQRQRPTDAEREKLRAEAREISSRAEALARERAQSARGQSRETAERQREFALKAAQFERMNDAEREQLRARAEALRDEAREMARNASRVEAEQLREMLDRARELAEDAEREVEAEHRPQ